MTSLTYEDFRARLKATETKALFKRLRDGTKAGNFGFGGLMGPAKFALTQRKAKIGGHGSMCRLMAREVHPCGSVKITEYRRRPCPPVCDQCVEVSAELKGGWLETWPEMPDYFDWVASLPGVQDGCLLYTSDAADE